MIDRIVRLMIATAAVVAGTCFDGTVSQASYGDAPWCLVKTGDDAYWSCQYRTSQECLAAIAGGERGFCDVSPWSSSTPAAGPQPAHRKPQAQ